MGKINTFTDLFVWKEGHQVVIEIYKLVKGFPRNSYSLTDQMTRSAVSVTSNIAEGFSRQSKKEKIQFYHIAKGSLTELHNQFFVCRDTGLITKEDFQNVETKLSSTVGC